MLACTKDLTGALQWPLAGVMMHGVALHVSSPFSADIMMIYELFNNNNNNNNDNDNNYLNALHMIRS